MKRSEDFLLRDVAGTLVIVPVGEAVSAFPGMITLNATAAYLWELLGIVARKYASSAKALST